MFFLNFLNPSHIGIIILVIIFLFFLLFFIKKRRFKKGIFDSLDIRLLSLTFPYEFKEEKIEIKNELSKVAQFFSLLSQKNKPFIFEIALAEKEKEIKFYLAIDKKEKEYAFKSLEGFWPEIQIKEEKEDYNIFNPQGIGEGRIITLKRNFVLPLKFADSFEADPLEPILSAFAKLSEEGEGMAYQLIVKRTGTNKNSKIKEVISELKKGNSLSNSLKSDNFFLVFLKDFFSIFISGGQDKDKNKESQNIDEKLIEILNKKASNPLFEVNLRIAVSASNKERVLSLLDQLSGAFSQFEQPEGNSFIIKKPFNLTNFFLNFSWRKFNKKEKIILSSLELAGLWHPPFSFIKTPELKKEKIKEFLPPADLPKEGLILGKNIFRGKETIVRVKDDDRRRHIYIIGQTGTGKSAFLFNLAKQDILNDKGLAVLDPHGDLINDLLSVIPQERYDDVIVFDPGELSKPLGLNMLEYNPNQPEQKTFIINELIEIFEQLYDLRQVGGPMFEQYMRNALLLLMDDPEERATLIEVPRVFADAEFRHRLLEKCKNTLTYNFWVKEAEKAGGEAALENITPYITSKFNIFLSNDYIRPMISQKENSIDFRRVMDAGKILLVNLSKGKIGEINARLLGMIIVGKLFMASLSRTDIPQDERKDFYLYMDEFQNFTTKTISQILSEARKYRLNLTLAHQFIGQLKEDTAKAVFGNVGTKIVFRVGAEDAEKLAKEFEPSLKLIDFVQLDNFNAYISLMVNGKATLPFNIQTFPPEKGNFKKVDLLKQLSALRYGRDRKDIEKETERKLREV